MKIFVTGGTGFIGRHLVWRLADAGHQVLFSGRNAANATEIIRQSRAAVCWIPLQHGSSDAAATLIRATQDCAAIVHCAALSAPWGTPQAFARANLDSCAEVLQACHANQVKRLVHLSTPSLFFDFRDRLGIREDESLPAPVNAYVRTKAMAETLVHEAGLDEAVILRPRAVFGPWDSALIPRLIRVIQRGAIPLMRGGRAQLDLTCIDNLIHAVELSLTQPLPRALCTYNVSNGTPLTFKALIHSVAEQFQLTVRTRRLPWRLVDVIARVMETGARLRNSGEPLLTRHTAGVLAFSQTLDLNAIRDELGYHPVVSQDDGIRLHAQWWLARQGAQR
jgi:nucleoside-diphosphate-sugar epimerase